MTEPTLRDIADKIDDVARLLARQAAAPPSSPPASAVDIPLLVELHALRTDAVACAVTARSRRERAAFEALAGGLERLLQGRGGAVVVPAAGDPFDGRAMEAVQVEPVADPVLHRTVARVLEPGLAVGSRSVRPARVVVGRAG